MNKNQQIFGVIAICAAIIIAGTIIAYKPGMPGTNGEPDYRYPSGVGTSLGLGAITYQGEDSDLKTISLTGSGSASAKANIAKVMLGVQTEDSSASDAIEENAETMTAIINALKDLGFTEDEIKTTSYTVYPNYNWEIRAVVGYTVTNMLQVEIENLDLIGPVIDAAGAAGANRVDGVSFQLSDEIMEEMKTNAYIAALNDAQQKADVIATTLDLEITGVKSVTESSYVPSRVYAYEEMDKAYATAGSAPTPIIEGDLTVNVNVHIVFIFE